MAYNVLAVKNDGADVYFLNLSRKIGPEDVITKYPPRLRETVARLGAFLEHLTSCQKLILGSWEVFDP